MKQTAVEWLVKQICTDMEMYDEYGNVSHIEFWNAFKSCTDLSEYINQAKKMEKEQIIRTASKMHSKGFDDCINSMDTGVGFNHREEAEKYYNETFKK
jgi:hypothetical protein